MDARKEGTHKGRPRLSLAGPSSQQHLLLSVSSVTDAMGREASGTGLSHRTLMGRPCVELQPHSDQGLNPTTSLLKEPRTSSISGMLTDLLPFAGISQPPSSALPGYSQR